MIAAGEASGDALAAELVDALRQTALFQSLPHAPEFFGAAGPRMIASGVESLVDLTQNAVVGLWEAALNALRFKRILNDLTRAAVQRRPDLIITVDNSGFNLRLLDSIHSRVCHQLDSPTAWRPRTVYYISPQVWASRARRVRSIQRHVDLLLSIFPFEKAWYAERAPELHVEFVGHPLIDRYARRPSPPRASGKDDSHPPRILLLPGSRRGELIRHLPVMDQASRFIRETSPEAQFPAVLPHDGLLPLAQSLLGVGSPIHCQVGDLSGALQSADFSLACSGTVTMECAWFGVPAIVLYKTSWLTYEIGRRLIQVSHLAMPNILRQNMQLPPLYPEFIQHDATGEALGKQALEWLQHPEKLHAVRQGLENLRGSLGESGAATRAALAITNLLDEDQGQ